MRHLIVKSLETLAYVGIALVVLAWAIAGANAFGFLGFIGGVIAGAIISIIIFGALFLLIDIADNTRRMAEHLENRPPQS